MSDEASKLSGRPSTNRPLLPKTDYLGSSGTDGAGPSTFQISSTRGKRALSKAACEACRRRKTKCDAQRPRCSACINNNRDCKYETSNPDESRSEALKRKHNELTEQQNDYEDLYKLLQTRPWDEAQDIVRRIRTGQDGRSVLQQVRGGDMLIQLALPPTENLLYDFENIAHAKPTFEDPQDVYRITGFLNSEVERGKLSVRSSPDQHAYYAPYHLAEVVDLRLKQVKASSWTSVIADDALVSKLLAIYFQFEYPTAPFFLKEQFLDDLVQGKKQFCSSLLVNAILATAAHGNPDAHDRVEYWNPGSLSWAFLAEARRLWDIEVLDPKLTTIHAGQILSLRFTADGLDRISTVYLNQVVHMAEGMHLFEAVDAQASPMNVARAYTAWALFAWQSMSCYYMRRAPCVPHPPKTPVVNLEGPVTESEEIHLKYPLSEALAPSHLMLCFIASVKLRLIENEILLATHGKHGQTRQLTLHEAFQYYGRLNEWYESLPVPLQPAHIALPHQLQLHMEYHHIVIELFESWPDATVSATRFQAVNTPSVSINELAKARLEALVRISLARNRNQTPGPLQLLYLLLLGSISARQLDSKPVANAAEYGTPLLCAKALREQGRNNYLAILMFQLLCKTLESSGDIVQEELARIQAECKAPDILPERVHTEWPVYQWIDSNNEKMGKLLEAFDGLSIEKD